MAAIDELYYKLSLSGFLSGLTPVQCVSPDFVSTLADISSKTVYNINRFFLFVFFVIFVPFVVNDKKDTRHDPDPS